MLAQRERNIVLYSLGRGLHFSNEHSDNVYSVCHWDDSDD